jgi:hypothetical protein
VLGPSKVLIGIIFAYVCSYGFKGAHRNNICVRVLIRVSVYAYCERLQNYFMLLHSGRICVRVFIEVSMRECCERFRCIV